MQLSEQSLKKLSDLITHEIIYRTGADLVRFFNSLGFSHTYGEGFPSRGYYTENRLSEINGSPEMDKCIRMVFDPRNLIDDIEKIDEEINKFNKYLAFDKWQVIRINYEISFEKKGKVIIPKSEKSKTAEADILDKEFPEPDLAKLNLETLLIEVLSDRISEIKNCLSTNAPLSVIFMAGSTLEGILLGIAPQFPRKFNTAHATPMKDGKPLFFADWKLTNLIDVSCEIGLLKEDVKKFSHVLREFRNYIHPAQQLASKFSPDIRTAKLCSQVLLLAIHQMIENIHTLKE
jgi:hypothetical protein